MFTCFRFLCDSHFLLNWFACKFKTFLRQIKNQGNPRLSPPHVLEEAAVFPGSRELLSLVHQGIFGDRETSDGADKEKRRPSS